MRIACKAQQAQAFPTSKVTDAWEQVRHVAAPASLPADVHNCWRCIIACDNKNVQYCVPLCLGAPLTGDNQIDIAIRCRSKFTR
jgi:hypothetical protein